jgi:hypothetical protein
MVLLAGFILVAITNKIATRFVGPRLSPQGVMVLRKLIRYLGVAFVIIIALNQVGLNLGAILGAAGVAGIAIGFAAPTSLSNIISGFFLIGERPFELDDFLIVHDPAEAPHSRFSICGHLHPVARTKDGKNTALRTPCFWLGEQQLILPSFDTFTGGAVVHPREGDRIFAPLDNRVVEIPPQAL